MGNSTEIAWADSTFNPFIGCQEVSPACDNCYAREYAKRFKLAVWGPRQPRSRTSPSNWKKPLQWNAKPFYECDCGWRGDKLTEHTRACGYPEIGRIKQVRRRVFCASLADVFDNEVPAEWRVDLLDMIMRSDNLDFLLLTKRVGNITKMLHECSAILRGDHGSQAERERGLSSGSVVGTGDRRGRENLEGSEADIRPLDWRNAGNSIKASASGNSGRGERIPSGSSDDRREAALRCGGTPRMEALQRPDSTGDDDQPQGRHQAEQQPVESGTGDIQRATQPCDQGVGCEASRRQGVEASKNISDGSRRGIDPETSGEGLEGEGHRRTIRDNTKRRVTDLSRNDLEARSDLLHWVEDWIAGNPPDNVWLGATICNQAEADRDIPKLLAVPAAVRFISMEPLLGPVDLRNIAYTKRGGTDGGWTLYLDGLTGHQATSPFSGVVGNRVDWTIVGGESGPKARPMHPAWVRSLRDQCAAAGVPFMFKQHGEFASAGLAGLDIDYCYENATTGGWVEFGGEFSIGEQAAPRSPVAAHVFRVGKKAAGRLLDGVLHNEFPKVAP